MKKCKYLFSILYSGDAWGMEDELKASFRRSTEENPYLTCHKYMKIITL